MRRVAYIRLDKRMGETVQIAALERYSFPLTYTDALGSLRERGEMLSGLRRHDELWLSHMHRLGTGKADLAKVLKAVFKVGAHVVEASTGLKSDDPINLVDMLESAHVFYARTLTPERAKVIGRLGGQKSGVTTRRKDRMPIKDALKFLNDHERYPTLVSALAAINKDKRYKRPWAVAHVYHLKKKDGVKIKDRQ